MAFLANAFRINPGGITVLLSCRTMNSMLHNPAICALP